MLSAKAAHAATSGLVAMYAEILVEHEQEKALLHQLLTSTAKERDVARAKVAELLAAAAPVRAEDAPTGDGNPK